MIMVERMILVYTMELRRDLETDWEILVGSWSTKYKILFSLASGDMVGSNIMHPAEYLISSEAELISHKSVLVAPSADRPAGGGSTSGRLLHLIRHLM